jgi:hypothetical protein
VQFKWRDCFHSATARKKITMKKLQVTAIATILVLGAGALFVLRAQSSTTQVPPDAVVAKLYRQNNLVFQPKSRALLDRYFEKSFADLIWKELLHYESSGRSEIEDFDPVLYFGVGNGVSSVSKPVIGKPTYEGQKAQLNVSYTVVCAPPDCEKRSVDKQTTIFLLAATANGWKINDIRYDCRIGLDGLCVDGKTSLFELYNMDAKATAAEREHWEQKSTSLDARLRPDVQGYKDYLQKYPNGAYADVARAKLGQLPMKQNENAGMPEASPARPKSAQTYTEVSFKEVKDLHGLAKAFPFLKQTIDSVISDDKDSALPPTKVYVSDLHQNGQARLFFLALTGALYCGSRGCALTVYMDQGNGLTDVLAALAGEGSPVYISRDQVSLLTCNRDGRVEWRFRNSSFEPMEGKPLQSQGLLPCSGRRN